MRNIIQNVLIGIILIVIGLYFLGIPSYPPKILGIFGIAFIAIGIWLVASVFKTFR